MNNKTLSQAGLYGFYFVAILNLLEQVINISWIDMATKPLLMITLLIYYLFGRKDKWSLLARLMTGALIFSWTGDVLLMLQGKVEGIFVFGLAAFLIAHIFYIFAYKQAKFSSPGELNNSFVRMRIIFLVLIGAALIYMLYPYLGELLYPVILYTIVIISMGIFALLRRGWTVDKSFIMVYSGALLFIMSDAMIAINKFMSPLFQARLLIMTTYIAAQFLIVKGILIHENTDEDKELSEA